MTITLEELLRRAQLAALFTDQNEIIDRMNHGQDVVALAPGQITTPTIAELSGVPHTYVKGIGRFF